MGVERLFEPRERPVRPAPVKGLTSDSIVPHASIDSLSFSVFDHARILTSGVYGAREQRSLLYFCQCVIDASAQSSGLWGHGVCRALGAQIV